MILWGLWFISQVFELHCKLDYLLADSDSWHTYFRNYDSLVMRCLLNQCQSGVSSLPVPPTHGRTFPAQTFWIRHLRTGWSPDLGGYLLKHIDRLPPDPWHHVTVAENDDHKFGWRFRPLTLNTVDTKTITGILQSEFLEQIYFCGFYIYDFNKLSFPECQYVAGNTDCQLSATA